MAGMARLLPALALLVMLLEVAAALTLSNAKQAVSAQGPERSTVRRVIDPANLFFDGIEGDRNGRRLCVQRVCCALTLVGGRTPLSW